MPFRQYARLHNRGRLKISLVGAIAVSTLLVTACAEKTEVAVSKVIRPAKLIEVTEQSDVRNFSFPAVIEARSTVNLGFQVAGKIVELKVKDGQSVNEGDVIAQLDQVAFKNELASAQAQYNNENAAYQRARRLLKDKAVSRSVFEQRRSKQRVARATLLSARQALSDTVLRSPFDGVVATVEGKQFQSVTAGEAILVLQTVGKAEAVVRVPASLFAISKRIKPLETSVLLDSAPDKKIPATMHSAETKADAKTQTFGVRFAFTPPNGLVVLPGMTGRVESKLAISTADGQTKRVRIPLSAVLADGEQRYAWVVDTQKMTVSRRNLKLADGVGEQLAVLDGLKAGETIVGAGASYLHDGMQISRYEQ